MSLEQSSVLQCPLVHLTSHITLLASSISGHHAALIYFGLIVSLWWELNSYFSDSSQVCKSDQRPSTLPVGPVVTVMGSLQTPTPNSTGENSASKLSYLPNSCILLMPTHGFIYRFYCLKLMFLDEWSLIWTFHLQLPQMPTTSIYSLCFSDLK